LVFSTWKQNLISQFFKLAIEKHIYYLPAVSNTGTVFESWQIGQSFTNLRPPPWTTLGKAPRLRWGIIMPPNLSNLFDSSATIIISI
jgi:hypothetical protein